MCIKIKVCLPKKTFITRNGSFNTEMSNSLLLII